MESVSTVTPESVSKENKTARTSIIKCPICQKEYKLKLDGNTSVTYQKHVERCKSNYEQFKQLRNKNVKGIENIIQNTNTQSNTQFNSTSYNRFNLQSIKTLINGLSGVIQQSDIPFIFPALNCLPGYDFITLDIFNEIYEKIQRFLGMEINYFNAKRREFENDATYISNLVIFIKDKNPKYYNEVYEPIAYRAYYYLDELQNIRMEYFTDIDFTIFRQTYRYKYPDEYSVLKDLKQLIAVKAGSNICLMKEHGVDSYLFSIRNRTDLKRILKDYTIWVIKSNGKKKDKIITLNDIFEKYKTCFEYKGFTFYDPNPEMFSYFAGYSYPRVSEVNLQLIAPFLYHIRHIICDDDPKVEDYVIRWVSYVLQNPGKKTGTALIILGQQGTGKNIFTNTICKLIANYTSPNVDSINDVVGKYNAMLENKMLIVFNEIQNFGEGKFANFDTFKSVITETRFRAEEKFIEKREAEQVANIILLSNNPMPVYVEESDRRYCFIETNGDYADVNTSYDEAKKKEKDEYFSELFRLKDDPVFLSNLLTYFLEFELKNFNPRDIPKTKTRENAITINRSPVTNFLIENFKKFKKGVHTQIASDLYREFFMNTYPTQKFSPKTYWAEMGQYCDKVKGRMKNYKDEYIGLGKDDNRNFYIFKRNWFEHFAKIHKENNTLFT